MTPSSSDPLQSLLAEERFVRALARQLVARDPEDAAQQTWVRALQQAHGEVRQPRSWLARILRRVVADTRRVDQHRDERQRLAAVPDVVPSSLELAEREERRRAIVGAVDALPAALRRVVLLRYFDDLPPRRIAAKLDVPVATVWTQLHRAVVLLRERLDAQHGGDRGAWMAAYAGFAARRVSLGSIVTSGVVAMAAKGKFVAAAVFVFAMLGAYALWPGGASPAAATREDSGAESGVPVAASGAALASADGSDAARRERSELVPRDLHPRGDLAVRLFWADDRTPAVGVLVSAARRSAVGYWRVDEQRRRTDERGIVRFERLRAGRTILTCDRARLRGTGTGDEDLEVKGGGCVDIECLLAGVTVLGIVVDSAGVPVGGAEVDLRGFATTEVATISASDGRFRIRGVDGCQVGARARGYVASPLTDVFAKGGTAEVRLELGNAGGVVEGVALSPDGRPVAGALAVVGDGPDLSLASGPRPPRPVRVRTDESGRFTAVGVALGKQVVRVRATGLPTWVGTCEVVVDAAAHVRVEFAAGATVRGTLCDAEGRGAPELAVVAKTAVGSSVDITASDGTFELIGVPAGEVELTAHALGRGIASARVACVAGEVSMCDLQLSLGVTLNGTLRDEHDAPIAANLVWYSDVVPGEPSRETVDAQGRFRLANLPEKGTITLELNGEGIWSKMFRRIDPRAGTVALRVQRRLPATARVVGCVLDPDGRTVAAELTATVGGTGVARSNTKDETGRFELGPGSPGSWYIDVASAGFPRQNVGPLEVAENGTVDVGTVRLSAGGYLEIDVVGADRRKWHLMLVDDEERVSAADTNDLVRVGDYGLLGTAPGFAAVRMPVAIRTGEKTRVAVQARAGTRQGFEVAAPADVESAMVRVRRDGKLVVRTSVSFEKDARPAEAWLEPGTYTVAVEHGERKATAEFTVGAVEGAPVRIVLK